jgi:8-oxo-dGTP pyrophosphatase MutT (NUDIX family)
MSASSHLPTAVPKAATVILTRRQAGQLQVYLLKRNPKSRLMAGNFVFPGGAVDATDRQVELFQNHCDSVRI